MRVNDIFQKGNLYQHKGNKEIYETQGVALCRDRGVEIVLYTKLEEPNLWFSRSKKEFEEKFEYLTDESAFELNKKAILFHINRLKEYLQEDIPFVVKETHKYFLISLYEGDYERGKKIISSMYSVNTPPSTKSIYISVHKNYVEQDVTDLIKE